MSWFPWRSSKTIMCFQRAFYRIGCFSDTWQSVSSLEKRCPFLSYPSYVSSSKLRTRTFSKEIWLAFVLLVHFHFQTARYGFCSCEDQSVPWNETKFKVRVWRSTSFLLEGILQALAIEGEIEFAHNSQFNSHRLSMSVKFVFNMCQLKGWHERTVICM